MRKLFGLLALYLFNSFNLSAVVLPPEKLLADDTLAVVTAPDFPKLQTAIKNSAQGQLWNDPAMKEFKDKFWSKIKAQYYTPLEHDLSVHLEDYTNLFRGQVTLALTQDGWMVKNASVPGILLLVDTKENSLQLKTNLTSLKQKWVDSGNTIKTEKIRDTDFSVITLTPSDFSKKSKSSHDPADATAADVKRKIYVGQAESLLIIGNSSSAIEKVLARMAGSSMKSLSELAAYDANAALFHDSPMYAWINSKALVDMFIRAAAQGGDTEAAGNPFGLKPDKALIALGLNGLNSLALSYQYNSEGSLATVTFSAPEATRAGILKLLAGEAKDATPPAFVPADAVKFQRWRLDGQKTWNGLRKIVNEVSPGAIGLVDFSLSSAEAGAKEKDPDFSFNKNLFGNLGDDVITYQKFKKGVALDDPNFGPSIYLIGSPNPEQLASALKNILILAGQQAAPTEKEFLGHKVFSIALPGSSTPANAGAAPRTLSYTWSGGYVVITADSSLLEEYLRSSDSHAKSLREAPGLSDAIQKVSGSGTSLFGYANDNEANRVWFENMKKFAGTDPLAGLAPMAASMGMGDIKMSEWFDLSLLPNFDKISKYFYFSVYSGSATGEGLSFKFYAPMPPQLRK